MIHHFEYAQREYLRTNLKSLYFMFLVLVLLIPLAGGISILVRWGLLAKGISPSFGELNEWQKLLGLMGLLIFGFAYIVLIVFTSSIAKALHFIEAEYKLDDISMRMVLNSTLVEMKWSEITKIKQPAKLLQLLPFWDGLVIFVSYRDAIPVGIAYLHNKEECMRILQSHLPAFRISELSKVVKHSPAGLWIKLDKRLQLRARRRLP